MAPGGAETAPVALDAIASANVTPHCVAEDDIGGVMNPSLFGTGLSSTVGVTGGYGIGVLSVEKREAGEVSLYDQSSVGVQVFERLFAVSRANEYEATDVRNLVSRASSESSTTDCEGEGSNIVMALRSFMASLMGTDCIASWIAGDGV